MNRIHKKKKCSNCYYANSHGSNGNCVNDKAIKHNDTFANQGWLAWENGSEIEKKIASQCPYYKESLFYKKPLR